MKSIFNKISILIVLVCIGFFNFSCLKDERFSEIPDIKYIDYQQNAIVDDNGIADKLIFSFTDGDGDIGLNEWDTLPPFDTSSRNLLLKLFEKKNGEFVEKILPAPFSYRLPYLTPEGQNKSLEGEIEVAIQLTAFLLPTDTVRFEAYMLDRAMHKSNVITTREITK
jgi:hypothetical protein